MPSLETPVLTDDANTIHRIDTRNASTLVEIELAHTDGVLTGQGSL
jgi:hypothetical protein